MYYILDTLLTIEVKSSLQMFSSHAVDCNVFIKKKRKNILHSSNIWTGR